MSHKGFDYSEDLDIVVPVKGLKGKDYELREASAEDGKKFKRIASQSVRQTDVGTKVVDPGGMEYLILTMCLYDLEANAFVTSDFLNTLKSRQIIQLSETALEISGLKQNDEDDEDELKN